MLPELPDQIPPDQEIASVTADGAFDARKCYDAIAARGAAALRQAPNAITAETASRHAPGQKTIRAIVFAAIGGIVGNCWASA